MLQERALRRFTTDERVCVTAARGSARPMRTPSRFVALRVIAASAAVVFAALVATGCGGGSDGGSGDTGLVGDEGPLAWLPTDTWLVATANVDPKAIDTAVASLDRLPIWALAEGFLPASDGTGLRRELLERIAKETAEGGGKPKVTATELETAFGNRAGFAITSTDFESFDTDEAPFVAWVEVDDEDAALAAAKDVFDGSEREAEHEGVTFFEAKDDEATFLVHDGLLIVSTTAKQIESLIDVREGDGSLAENDVAAAVLEVGVGDAIAGFAIASEPLLGAAPELVRTQAEEVEDDGEATEAEKRNAEKAAKIADELEPLLESNAIDGLIADWIGGSVTIDETGLRMRGAWSNPRELASPEPGSRELVERMPIEAPVVNGSVSDGSALRRLQSAWSEVRDAYDLDLRQLVASECSQADRWACDLGIELVLATLEDESLAAMLEERGDAATVTTQDMSGLFESLGAMEAAQEAAPGAAVKPAPRAKPLSTRLYEFVSSSTLTGDYTPPADLVAAALAAGLVVHANDDMTEVTVRVQAGSPLAREIGANIDAEGRAALAMFGIDVRALLAPAGVTFSADEVDGLQVWGLPQNAPSKVIPALKGSAETLADSSSYRAAVAAAKPPKKVGMYGFVDLRSYVEGMLDGIGASDPDVQRIVPTVRNNLADVPGIVTWSTREESDGEEVGVIEMAMPIIE